MMLSINNTSSHRHSIIFAQKYLLAFCVHANVQVHIHALRTLQTFFFSSGLFLALPVSMPKNSNNNTSVTQHNLLPNLMCTKSRVCTQYSCIASPNTIYFVQHFFSFVHYELACLRIDKKAVFSVVFLSGSSARYEIWNGQMKYENIDIKMNRYIVYDFIFWSFIFILLFFVLSHFGVKNCFHDVCNVRTGEC